MNVISVYLAFCNFGSLFTKYNKYIYIYIYSNFYTKYVAKNLHVIFFFKASFVINRLRQKANAKN